jgi:hypothetical protein
MLKAAFTVFSVLFAAEVFAKYHPKTARLKRPSAKLIEVASGWGEQLLSEIRQAAAKMNPDDQEEQRPPRR